MPKAIHDRAMRLLPEMKETYTPEKAKQVAFAVATQQAHARGEAPKKWRGKPFGTPQGKREARRKFDKRPSEYEPLKEAAGRGLGPGKGRGPGAAYGPAAGLQLGPGGALGKVPIREDLTPEQLEELERCQLAKKRRTPLLKKQSQFFLRKAAQEFYPEPGNANEEKELRRKYEELVGSASPTDEELEMWRQQANSNVADLQSVPVNSGPDVPQAVQMLPLPIPHLPPTQGVQMVESPEVRPAVPQPQAPAASDIGAPIREPTQAVPGMMRVASKMASRRGILGQQESRPMDLPQDVVSRLEAKVETKLSAELMTTGRERIKAATVRPRAYDRYPGLKERREEQTGVSPTAPSQLKKEKLGQEAAMVPSRRVGPFAKIGQEQPPAPEQPPPTVTGGSGGGASGTTGTEATTGSAATGTTTPQIDVSGMGALGALQSLPQQPSFSPYTREMAAGGSGGGGMTVTQADHDDFVGFLADVQERAFQDSVRKYAQEMFLGGERPHEGVAVPAADRLRELWGRDVGALGTLGGLAAGHVGASRALQAMAAKGKTIQKGVPFWATKRMTGKGVKPRFLTRAGLRVAGPLAGILGAKALFGTRKEGADKANPFPGTVKQAQGVDEWAGRNALGTAGLGALAGGLAIPAAVRAASGRSDMPAFSGWGMAGGAGLGLLAHAAAKHRMRQREAMKRQDDRRQMQFLQQMLAQQAQQGGVPF